MQKKYQDITIAITSCGRYSLLKKTIRSLGENIDLQNINKIITEDSRNNSHIQKIINAQKNGFLSWWEVVFTNGKRQHWALIELYKRIHTKYVFHCEEDWLFRKMDFDFLNVSQFILEKYQNIGMVLLRDLASDGWLKKEWVSMEERYNELFSWETFIYKNLKFAYCRNDEDWDFCKGFSYNPWLRRTQEMRNIMFWYEDIVDEQKLGERYAKSWLVSVYIEPWITVHIGDNYLSTKFMTIFEKGILIGIWQVLYNSYTYRIGLLKNILLQNWMRLYWYFDGIVWSRWCMDIVAGTVRKIRAKPVLRELLKNIEDIEEMHIPYKWFTENKPLGISGVARLKNAEDFLELVIESHLPFLNEIILVDNMSTDNTKTICKKLQKKYPEKIKFYEYNYPVFPIWSNNGVQSQSIHSLAYYYNWCFAKSKYKYVMKLDDDNLLLPEKWNAIRNCILKHKPNKFCAYWWFNILKKDDMIWICEWDKYSWKYWDHWIYPVSKYTFYTQNDLCEQLNHNLFFKRFDFSFLHLKYLKRMFGLHNCVWTSVAKERNSLIKNSEILDFGTVIKNKTVLETVQKLIKNF